LFVPDTIPPLPPAALAGADFAARASATLQSWLAGELATEVVDRLCRQAFDFPVPVISLDPETFLLELFHGPTAAFKDFGARFLALALDALRDPAPPLTILVATSGDTGSAVAHAFAKLPAVRVVLLYPPGVSARCKSCS
jgi:threonine synthase